MDLLLHFLHDLIVMAKDLVFLHCRHDPNCSAVVDKRFDYHTLQLMTRGRVEVWYGPRREELGPAAAWPAYPGPRIRFHAAASVGGGGRTATPRSTARGFNAGARTGCCSAGRSGYGPRRRRRWRR